MPTGLFSFVSGAALGATLVFVVIALLLTDCENRTGQQCVLSISIKEAPK